MRCACKLGSHADDCHYLFDEPKTYEQYTQEACETYKSIMNKYGAPLEARPPRAGKTLDELFKKNLDVPDGRYFGKYKRKNATA